MPAHDATVATDTERVLRIWLERVAPTAPEEDLVRTFGKDPVKFAEQVLGIKIWSRQKEILRSVLKHERIAIRSGHKTGKSTALAVLALWFYCTFPRARVVIMAATARQVDGIIWKEVKRLARQAKIKIPNVDKIHDLARSGIEDPVTFAEIKGYTAKDPEAVAGTSAPYILYLIDEASGVEDKIFEAIKGNRAGGNAIVILISNPTRADGEFYEAFHSKSQEVVGPTGYFNIHIDSRESPNITGECRIPGLAVQSWVDEMIREYGEESAWVLIRIKGSFAIAEAAKVFPLALLAEAQERWDTTLPTGRLYIGVDPAGPGDGGDKSAFCSRRGNKVIEIRSRTGLSAIAHAAIIEDMIANVGKLDQLPVVVLDGGGSVGQDVYLALKQYAEATEHFEVYRVRPSDNAVRQPLIYTKIRDELFANARAWVKGGGAIPLDTMLEKDLHAPEFNSDIRSRLKLTPKEEIRVQLGRSPDVGDAFCLSVWEPLGFRIAEAAQHDDPPKQSMDPDEGEQQMSVYETDRLWNR